MKRFLGVIVGIAAFIIGAVALYNKFEAKSVEAAREVDRGRIAQEYFERIAWIRSNPDEKAYKDEVGTFLHWYFNQVNAHVNQFRENRDFDDYVSELDGRKKAGNKDSQMEEKKASYEYVKAVFDTMKSGKYSPVFSATDKGMRFDIASADVKPVRGKPQIVLAIVLWGAQREKREDGKMSKMVTSSSFALNTKLIEEKGKLYGEMNASGDPAGKIDWPERMIWAFPPQVVLGHFDMDLIPAEVAKIEFNFVVTSRSPSGGDAMANYTWKLDAPAEWKLRPGEKWEGAEESVRPEEEIDPAAAAKHGQARK
jgi:hypothetical protein